MAGTGSASDDDARTVLERELYWAGDPNTAETGSSAELRISLHDFVAAMRADEHSRVPSREPMLGSTSRWKRSVKVFGYGLLRPVTHRYDRLIGDLAALDRAIVERLAEAEAEIATLRRELDELRRRSEPD